MRELSRIRFLSQLILLLCAMACGPAATESDEGVLEQLRQAGSNLQKPHPVQFYFFFPTRMAAQRACKVLEEQGFSVVVQPGASPSQFLCQAGKELVPDIETMRQLRARFETLAEELGGEYDGWVAPVVG